MSRLRRRFAGFALPAAFLAAILPAAATESSFPFGSTLMLDTAPMPGSKRVPMLQVEENGTAAIDLWCSSVRGTVTVGGDTISIVPVGVTPAECPLERKTRDVDLMTNLLAATGWRRSGDVVELLGISTLRFRLMTN